MEKIKLSKEIRDIISTEVKKEIDKQIMSNNKRKTKNSKRVSGGKIGVSKNDWIKFLKKFRNENKHLPSNILFKEASKSYKKLKKIGKKKS